MTISIPPEAKVSGPAVATPPRRPGSVRRTSTINMAWPRGREVELELIGRSRDLFTPVEEDTDPVVLAQDDMYAAIDPSTREIRELTAFPERPALQQMIGARGGGNSRGKLAEVVPDELTAGTPLYLLLDDIPGCSLIAGFSVGQWYRRQILQIAPVNGVNHARKMEGVCTGFMPGSGALNPDGSSMWSHQVQHVQPLPRGDDPYSWHEYEDRTDMSMRRARRIDVWVDDVIHIDSFFQDSSTRPEGGRVAVHEYCLAATADVTTGELLSLDADPRVLPYDECPMAAMNIQTLVGTPMRELRAVVLERLRGTQGCTHLNDALRAMAEVPTLVAAMSRPAWAH